MAALNQGRMIEVTFVNPSDREVDVIPLRRPLALRLGAERAADTHQHLSRSMQVLWERQEGQEELYFALGAGKEQVQQTYVGHKWVIRR